jgi:WD40 repeat protein
MRTHRLGSPILIAAATYLVLIVPATAQTPPGRPSRPVDLYGDPLPPGASARLGTTRFKYPSHRLIGLAFSTDGGTLIGAGEEQAIYFWDTATGRQLHTLSTAPLRGGSFALSPDGRTMALAGTWYDEPQHKMESQVWILDPESGQRIQTIQRGERRVGRLAMAFRPDGKLLFSLGEDGNFCVEEVASGKQILRRQVPRDGSPTLALSPDGSTVAISTGSNTVKFLLWKWQDGEEPKELSLAEDRRQRFSGHVAFSPDGKQLVACVYRAESPIYIWDAETGDLRQRLRVPQPNSYALGTVLVSPDGKTVLAPGWRRDSGRSVVIHSWNLISGEYQGELSAPAGGLLAMSRDGRLLALTSGTSVRLWKWPSREEILPNDATHSGVINRIALAPAGDVVTGSDDGTVRIWDAASSRQLQVMRHEKWVRDAAVSPDGLKVASSSLDDTVRLWNMSTGREIYRLPGHGRVGGVRALGFSGDGNSLVSFGDDFNLRRWDVATANVIREQKLRPTGIKVPQGADPFAAESRRLDRAAVSPDGSLLALSAGKLFLFDCKTCQELQQIENPGTQVMGLTFSPDSRYLLAGAWGKQVVTKLADGTERFSLDANNPVTLWDTASGKVVRQIILPEGGVGPVVFSASGHRFAVSALRPSHQILVFETATGKKLQSIAGVPCRAWSLCFGRGDRSIIAGLADGTAVIWSLAE